MNYNDSLTRSTYMELSTSSPAIPSGASMQQQWFQQQNYATRPQSASPMQRHRGSPYSGGSYSPRYSPGASTSRRPPGGPRRLDDTGLSASELERRNMRRERNRVAAARCRQKRDDLTYELQQQTDVLEDKKAHLLNELRKLQAEKAQLEACWDAHHPVCRSSEPVKSEPFTPIFKIATNVAMETEEPFNFPVVTDTEILRRPMELPIAHSSQESGTKLELTTPGLGLCNFETGLTPITGISCSQEAQRSSSDSDQTDLNSSPVLTAL